MRSTDQKRSEGHLVSEPTNCWKHSFVLDTICISIGYTLFICWSSFGNFNSLPCLIPNNFQQLYGKLLDKFSAIEVACHLPGALDQLVATGSQHHRPSGLATDPWQTSFHMTVSKYAVVGLVRGVLSNSRQSCHVAPFSFRFRFHVFSCTYQLSTEFWPHH